MRRSSHDLPLDPDILQLAAEEPGGRHEVGSVARPWKVLVVDDEEDVHHVTRLVLGRYRFEGCGVELLSAFSGAAARRVIADHPDIAVILLDVVMEQEDSGLRLVRHIRDVLGNRHVRIILRTGQPGQAPEQQVVADYDINDYKAKVELTADKLCTAVTSALRSWRDIRALEKSRRGLERVIDASGDLFRWRDRDALAGSIMRRQLTILNREPSGEVAAGGFVARLEDEGFVVVDACGRYAGQVGDPLADVGDDRLRDLIHRARLAGDMFFSDGACCSRFRAEDGSELLFVLEGLPGLDRLDRDLLRLYVTNAGLAYANVNLALEVIEGQKEIITTLSEVVETRSRETAHHVLRVGKMAHLLALRSGMDAERAGNLKLAAPMHDVGKVGIPDAILHKPGPLSDQEFEIMKRHATIGHEILAKSGRQLMRTAARVALEHHERWDGRGYPHGLAGAAISIEGRVTALVDVFDALINRRVYREARPLENVVALLRRERGRQFDPDLVDVFLAHLDDFVAIVAAHPDDAMQEVRQQRGTA